MLGDPAVSTSTPDPFNLESLRLNQDHVNAQLKRELLTVPVRRPSPEWFIRTHPDEQYRIQTMLLQLKEDREIYLVAQGLWGELSVETTVSPYLLITTMCRPSKEIFLWPIRMPGHDGKIDGWNRSAQIIATELALKGWVRVQSNKTLQSYTADVAEASSHWGDPMWPDLSFQQLIKLAFRDRLIDTLEHPVIRRLRGVE